MKIKFLPSSGKAVWQNNKPFAWFLLSLLLIHSVLKIIFYQYNQPLLFAGAETGITGSEKLQLVKWSVAEDTLTLLGINSFLLFALAFTTFFTKKISTWLNIVLGWLIIPFFALVNSVALLLNLADIFYFRFHFQRANADLLFVLDHPWNRLMQQPFFIILIAFAALGCIIYLVWRMHIKLFRSFIRGNNCRLITIILFAGLASALLFKNTSLKFLVPTYPMIQLQGRQVPFVQNSFHTFLYSCFRKGNTNISKNYMSDAEADSSMHIMKRLNISNTNTGKKNIVLFIMESVPYDFFDSASEFKVTMPFFDSLLQKSTFFNNAFCYAHESNKGITAILTGFPTLSDIPLYHSPYVNMPFTPVGTALKKLNYRSLFCIGDEYDNFGFAKCMKWLGIEQYYSKEDIPGYKNLPAHSMGLQDAAVLDFFNQKINQHQMPFLAIHYNISTHYPYDIPESFAKTSPVKYTAAMKAMQYYDHSLQNFFNTAKNEPWFANTRFIFCSDHWLFPQGKPGYAYKAVSSNRIPIIIFDPADTKKKIDNRLASQFDIHATILAAAGYRDSIISYGNNLLDSNIHGNYIFSKTGNTIYQVMDTDYVLGFNPASNKAEYLFNFKKDIRLNNNLATDKNHSQVVNRLLTTVKAFLQKTVLHYNSNAGK
ncbi:MAG: sulfatase-like hydrolase/transferase [Ferruginibacter sp.]|nr:sulfatase-like hydrolase/transferase [Ferruginibacter sp.]